MRGGTFHVQSGLWETRMYAKMVVNPAPQSPFSEKDLASNLEWYKEKFHRALGGYYWDARVSKDFPKRVQMSLCGTAVLRPDTKTNRYLWTPDGHTWSYRSNGRVCDACARIYQASHGFAYLGDDNTR